MKFSSIISLLILCFVLNFFSGCAHLKKTSNEQKSRPIKFQEIKLIVTFPWIAPDERPKIEEFFKNPKLYRSLETRELIGNERFGYEILMDSKNLRTIEDLNKRIIAWNKAILSIGTKNKNQILGEDKVTIKLGYISTRATSMTSAELQIVPEPFGAKLFIDVDDSELDLPINPFDGSIILNAEGRFETILPFSFIMENSRIYFRTRLNNITRYFYYDLKLEEQKEIFGIISEDDYKYYQKHGEPPPRD